MILVGLCTFSLIFMALASMEFPGICRIKKESVLRFLAVMAVVTFFRFLVHKMVGFPSIPKDSSPMNTLSVTMVLGVFWEDAFFTLPILIADKLKASSLLKGIMLTMSSLVFASGHIDYGYFWAFLTLFYVPFISYKYGKQNGLGTVMVCHILYDLITILTFRHVFS